MIHLSLVALKYLHNHRTSFAVRLLWVLAEPGTLMYSIGNIWMSRLLQNVEHADHPWVMKIIVEWFALCVLL